LFKNRLLKTIYSLYPFEKGRLRLREASRRRIGDEVCVGRDWQGNRFLLDLDNFIDVLLYLDREYEGEEMRHLLEVASQSKVDTFLDIGANIGCYSLAMSSVPTIRTIHAFEPDPRNYAQLQANLWLNGKVGRIQAHALALSDQLGTIDFRLAPRKRERGKHQYNTGTSGMSDERSADSVPMKCAPLDDLLQMEGQRIIVKIDVEGHEAAVLRGMRKCLDKNQCTIMVEVWKGNTSSSDEVTRFFSSMNYHVVDRHGDNCFFARGETNGASR